MSTLVDILARMIGKKRSAASTKAAILETTRRMFAEHGYDRTTIRMIAAETGCDPALVMRYFGSKRALFIQAVQLPLENFPDAPPGQAGDLVGLAETLLEHWHNDRTFIGCLRSAASDEEAAELMREFFEVRVRSHQSRVFGLPPDQSVCFGAMLIGIAFAREIAKIPPLSTKSSHELARLVASVLDGAASRHSPDGG